MANNLQTLHTLGQSPWYDNISRDLLDNGGLQSLVDQGIRGLTSNPSIFKKAITSSSAYDAAIAPLAAEGKSSQEVYESLAVEDIQRAADILRPVFDSSGGHDGYVSLEVSPLLAANTKSTLSEARRLRAMVNRPNLYIKIPGTVEGIPAIEQALYEGIAVNVTLIFSRTLYDRVMEAYLRGLERRADEGKPIDQSSSVASFFISRVDSLVDKLIQQKMDAGGASDLANLAGKAGLANAKLAYHDFKNVFGGHRFAKLAAHGAHVQRPLWASTSTKNPAYPDTLYVDNLIGPDTVNTMPGETIDAFLDHGTPATTIEDGVTEAKAALRGLEAAGISIDAVTAQLLQEGVEKFAEPFHDLLAAIAEKSQSMAATD